MRGGYRGLHRRSSTKANEQLNQSPKNFVATEEPPLPPMRSFDRLSAVDTQDAASNSGEVLREPEPLVHIQHKADVKMGKIFSQLTLFNILGSR